MRGWISNGGKKGERAVRGSGLVWAVFSKCAWLRIEGMEITPCMGAGWLGMSTLGMEEILCYISDK